MFLIYILKLSRNSGKLLLNKNYSLKQKYLCLLIMIYYENVWIIGSDWVK